MDKSSGRVVTKPDLCPLAVQIRACKKLCQKGLEAFDRNVLLAFILPGFTEACRNHMDSTRTFFL